MSEKIVIVALKARTPAKVHNGVYEGLPIKDQFYTAGHHDGDGRRYLGPVNHGQTIVIDGNILGMSQDVLLRTGNHFLGLQPEARAISDSKEDGAFVTYRTQDLPVETERKLLSGSGLLEIYERCSDMAAQLCDSTSEKLRLLNRAVNPKAIF